MQTYTNKRDYDKEPIYIQDINPLVPWLTMIYFIFPLILIIVILSFLFFLRKLMYMDNFLS
jgi:hypothetical protein